MSELDIKIAVENRYSDEFAKIDRMIAELDQVTQAYVQYLGGVERATSSVAAFGDSFKRLGGAMALTGADLSELWYGGGRIEVTSSLPEGTIVALSSDGKVVPANANSPAIGVVTNVTNGRATVNITGSTTNDLPFQFSEFWIQPAKPMFGMDSPETDRVIQQEPNPLYLKALQELKETGKLSEETMIRLRDIDRNAELKSVAEEVAKDNVEKVEDPAPEQRTKRRVTIDWD